MLGKTTLVNHFSGDVVFDTQEVREKDSKGKHTTTRRQLISLKNGALLIDTPGMRELGGIGIESGLNEVFDDFIELSKHCQFKDCSHTQEKGCAIQKAIKDGVISKERFQSYDKMNKESKFNEMSFIEKRRKDKKFGKMVKSVMKHHGKNH